MSPAFPSRRAAQFEALLDGTLTEAPSAELAQLLALAEQVRAVPEMTPRADFAADLRERLMAEAPTALAAPPADDASSTAAARLTVGRGTPSKSRRERRIGVAIAAFSLVGATAATAVASQGSMPGDTLYPVKRLVEDAQTSLTMGDDAKADILLSHARTRLDEARQLSERDDIDTARVEQALRDFGTTADHASSVILAEYADHGDQERIDDLRTFTEQGVTTLSELATLLPPSVDGVLAEVTNTLLNIDQSAAQACPACDAAGIVELPAPLVDLLGTTMNDVALTGSSLQQGTTTKHAGKSAKPGGSDDPSQAPAGSSSEQLTDPVTGAAGDLGGALGGSKGGKGGEGDKGGKPSSGPTSVGGAVGDAGGAVGGTVSGVGGAVGGVGDQVGGPVGGVVGGVGGTVDDLGDTVGGVTGDLGDAVDGIAGTLLPPKPSTTP